MSVEGLFQFSDEHHYFLSKNGKATCWAGEVFRGGLSWSKGQGSLGGGASRLGKNHTLLVPLEYLL